MRPAWSSSMRVKKPSKGRPLAVAPVGEGKIPGFVDTPWIVPPQPELRVSGKKLKA
jgi:hypothetical protein